MSEAFKPQELRPSDLPSLRRLRAWLHVRWANLQRAANEQKHLALGSSPRLHPGSEKKKRKHRVVPALIAELGQDAEGWNELCYLCHFGGELLMCDACPRVAHVECVHLKDIPEDDWFCTVCAAAKAAKKAAKKQAAKKSNKKLAQSISSSSSSLSSSSAFKHAPARSTSVEDFPALHPAVTPTTTTTKNININNGHLHPTFPLDESSPQSAASSTNPYLGFLGGSGSGSTKSSKASKTPPFMDPVAAAKKRERRKQIAREQKKEREEIIKRQAEELNKRNVKGSFPPNPPCFVCNKSTNSSDRVACNVCVRTAHSTCAGLDIPNELRSNYVFQLWTCSACHPPFGKVDQESKRGERTRAAARRANSRITRGAPRAARPKSMAIDDSENSQDDSNSALAITTMKPRPSLLLETPAYVASLSQSSQGDYRPASAISNRRKRSRATIDDSDDSDDSNNDSSDSTPSKKKARTRDPPHRSSGSKPLSASSSSSSSSSKSLSTSRSSSPVKTNGANSGAAPISFALIPRRQPASNGGKPPASSLVSVASIPNPLTMKPLNPLTASIPNPFAAALGGTPLTMKPPTKPSGNKPPVAPTASSRPGGATGGVVVGVGGAPASSTSSSTPSSTATTTVDSSNPPGLPRVNIPSKPATAVDSISPTTTTPTSTANSASTANIARSVRGGLPGWLGASGIVPSGSGKPLGMFVSPVPVAPITDIDDGEDTDDGTDAAKPAIAAVRASPATASGSAGASSMLSAMFAPVARKQPSSQPSNE